MQSLQDLAREEMERKLKEQEEERERLSVSYKNEDLVNLFIPDIQKNALQYVADKDCWDNAQ